MRFLLTAALAIAALMVQDAPRPTMPPPHGQCKFDAPAFWGVGIDGLITAATVEKGVDPVPVASTASGVVIFDARINEKGKVTSACVLRRVSAEADAAALAALKRWTFRPARLKAPPHTAVAVVQTCAVKVRRTPQR